MAVGVAVVVILLLFSPNIYAFATKGTVDLLAASGFTLEQVCPRTPHPNPPALWLSPRGHWISIGCNKLEPVAQRGGGCPRLHSATRSSSPPCRRPADLPAEPVLSAPPPPSGAADRAMVSWGRGHAGPGRTRAPVLCGPGVDGTDRSQCFWPDS